MGLADESAYIWAVRATDLVGNAATEDLSFLVDMRPPLVANVRFPLSTNGSSILVSYAVRDGSLGSNVSQAFCLMVPVE